MKRKERESDVRRSQIGETRRRQRHIKRDSSKQPKTAGGQVANVVTKEGGMIVQEERAAGRDREIYKDVRNSR